MISSSENDLIGTGGAGGLVNGSNGNLVGVVNPGLGTLGNNGGSTQTIALLADSPAIGAGANPENLSADQRGYVVLAGTRWDIGAYQTGAGGQITSPSSTSQASSAASSNATSTSQASSAASSNAASTSQSTSDKSNTASLHRHGKRQPKEKPGQHPATKRTAKKKAVKTKRHL